MAMLNNQMVIDASNKTGGLERTMRKFVANREDLVGLGSMQCVQCGVKFHTIAFFDTSLETAHLPTRPSGLT